jgi:hypothetical protein
MLAGKVTPRSCEPGGGEWEVIGEGNVNVVAGETSQLVIEVAAFPCLAAAG